MSRVVYVVVRESLGMSRGKIAAQTAHVMALLCHYDPSGMSKWTRESNRKLIVKGADEKDWAKLQSSTFEGAVQRDAGLTEVDPGTETVVAFFPFEEVETPKLIKRLRLLKEEK